MAKGDTKTNQYLDIAANGTRADLPTDTCCETRSQTLIREVAERIMDVEDEVEEIKNNPDVVDIVATYADLQAYDTQHLTDKDIIRVLQDETHDGESTYYRYNKQSDTWTYVGESKQYEDFVGTDGTTAGEAGLVPAPATTDAGKFLSASGLWEAVQAGGGITELTSADYNYHASGNVDDGIALWLLPSGWYEINDENVAVYTDNYSRSTVHAGSYLRFDNQFGNFPKGLLYTKRNSEGIFWNAMTATGGVYWSPLFGGVRLDTIVSQSTGTSTDSVMSQNAVTSMVFKDPASGWNVRIGKNADTLNNGVAIGIRAYSGGNGVAMGMDSTSSSGNFGIAIGNGANSATSGSIALGAYSGGSSNITSAGIMHIGSSNTSYGYNSSNYRLLTGLYDGQSAHDAATYGQVISYSAINGAGAPTTATEGKYVGQLYYDTTNEAMYFLKTIDTTTDPDTYTWEALGGGSSVNVVQTTGTSTTDVMSQNATTSMVFADPSTTQKVQIGNSASAGGNNSVAVGYGASSGGTAATAIGRSANSEGTQSAAIGFESVARGTNSIALGHGATASSSKDGTISVGASAGANSGNASYSTQIGYFARATSNGGIALGSYSSASAVGEMNIGSTSTNYGYNNSNYRRLSGVYDPQNAHDAATKGYVDAAVAGAAYDPTISNNTLYL